MNKCEQCGTNHTRLKANSRNKPARFCSVRCIKRASYARCNPDVKMLGRNKQFWQTETGIGYKWELYVVKKLNGTHMPFNTNGIDLVADIGTVDVKVCEKYNTQWVFNRNKKKTNIDWYYCVCLEKGKPVKELLIPSKNFKSCGITVGTVSPKYDQYAI